MKTNYLLIVLLLIILYSCGNPQNQANQSDQTIEIIIEDEQVTEYEQVVDVKIVAQKNQSGGYINKWLASPNRKTAYESRVEQIESEGVRKLPKEMRGEEGDPIIKGWSGKSLLNEGAREIARGGKYGETRGRQMEGGTYNHFYTPPRLPPENVARWYVRELENAKRSRTAEDTYKESRTGRIEQDIKSSFEKWSQRGEYEKKEIYDERSRTQSEEIFTNIFSKTIKERFDGSQHSHIGLSKYDPDSEFFTASLFRSSYRINIPIEQAERFKEWFPQLNTQSASPYQWSFYDWHFNKDYELFPKLIVLTDKQNNAKYEFQSLESGAQKIAYFFDNFGIANPYLKGYVFICNINVETVQKTK